jgi:hypothetical protein
MERTGVTIYVPASRRRKLPPLEGWEKGEGEAIYFVFWGGQPGYAVAALPAVGRDVGMKGRMYTAGEKAGWAKCGRLRWC